MALRDQPYLPLYVQDYLTDEKLNMCSLSTQGVYIKLLCLFHKSETYGGILLKQKDKQNESMCLNFACKIAKLLPISVDDIKNAIAELLEENVLTVDGDFLFQKRMVRDNEISLKRAVSGKKGGIKSKNKNSNKNNFASTFAQANKQANNKAKSQANTEDENEYEYEYEIKDEINKGVIGEKEEEENEDDDIVETEVVEDVYLFEHFWDDYDKKVGDKQKLRKKWAKIPDKDKIRIRDYIPRYKAAQPDKKYRKNPETFLNNKSWNDEIISSNGNRNTTKQRSGITEDYKKSILERLQGAGNTEDVPQYHNSGASIRH